MLIRWIRERGAGDPEPLADALMIGLAWLSAAARDGMSQDSLKAAAEVIAKAFAEEADAVKSHER